VNTNSGYETGNGKKKDTEVQDTGTIAFNVIREDAKPGSFDRKDAKLSPSQLGGRKESKNKQSDLIMVGYDTVTYYFHQRCTGIFHRYLMARLPLHCFYL
jgi:hypothetical protein